MSPIWCCLVLSTILGLCGSAVLKEDFISKHRITPEITQYGSDSPAPLKCGFSLQMGKRINGDHKILDTIIIKPKSNQVPYTLEFNYPDRKSEATQLYAPISCMKVENVNCKSTDPLSYNHTIAFTDGVIGEKRVSMELTVDDSNRREFKVEIYVDPNHQ